MKTVFTPENGNGYLRPFTGDPADAWKRDLVPGDQVLFDRYQNESYEPGSVESYPYQSLQTEIWRIVIQDTTGAQYPVTFRQVHDRISPPKKTLSQMVDSLETIAKKEAEVRAAVSQEKTVQLTTEQMERVFETIKNAKVNNLGVEKKDARLDAVMFGRSHGLPKTLCGAMADIVSYASKTRSDTTDLVRVIATLANFLKETHSELGTTLNQMEQFQGLLSVILSLQQAKPTRQDLTPPAN